MQEIEFIKQGRLSSKELEAFVSVLGLAGGNLGQNCSFGRKPQEGAVRVQSADKSIARLESMGVKIYGLDVSSSDINTSWGNLVGYDQQQRYVKARVHCSYCCYIFNIILYNILFVNTIPLLAMKNISRIIIIVRWNLIMFKNRQQM